MKKIGIIGATGYTGEELLKTLARHDRVQVVFATSEHQNGIAVFDVFPYLPRYKTLSFCTAEEAASIDVDLVFTCLHAGESVKWVKRFVDMGVKVIDLGADFRFKVPQDYEQWYKMPHTYPELLSEAVYGLTEWYRDDIRTARIVGNPGCYPTSVLMALLPFIDSGFVSESPIFIDSKSGVSGAGKKATETTHYVSANESVSPYKVGRVHRHVGEMEKEVRAWGGTHTLVFTPHLTPLTRGMLSTIYVQLDQDSSSAELFDVLDFKYANEPFVHVLRDQLPSTKMTQNSNFCFISLQKIAETKSLILFSSIDNLGKGASTQAVQNMNVMLDFDETTGLL